MIERRSKLPAGVLFALYVAGYTSGRLWIEMLRVDPANRVLGVRLNVITSLLLLAVSSAVAAFALVQDHRNSVKAEEDTALLANIKGATRRTAREI